ncbi:MAG TPA: PDZ domain-containing protein [Sedimenticola thiotaurini]|uniref:Curli production assembly/transport component CsgG n=1 Tax=Sedimenticola thiotaurini TaxID=1543721 RepID=A0A831RKF9_9GAMM|nr:PDZ domain-containing protein [Sedimenticola thiotaurini]
MKVSLPRSILFIRMVVLVLLFPVVAAGWAAEPAWGLRIAERANAEGAVVTGVTPGGNAAGAGLARGDVILRANGRRVITAADLAGYLRGLPSGSSVVLTVERNGWEKEMTIVRGGTAGQGSFGPVHDGATGPDAGVRRPTDTGPLKATVAVGDFQVKAKHGAEYIGDGLREMLLTALYDSRRFIVVERIDIKGITAEQALSRSSMARADQAIPTAGMDVADIMIYGTVTEFMADASGMGTGIGSDALPFNLSTQSRKSYLGLDFRVVDVRTGRLILARHLAGNADASMGTMSAAPTASAHSMPFSFGAFRNTPLERVVRSLVNRVVVYITNNLPKRYFRHR